MRAAHIDIRHSTTGHHLGRVTLRPVPLGYLADLVGDPARSREREALARRLAFGV